MQLDLSLEDHLTFIAEKDKYRKFKRYLLKIDQNYTLNSCAL